MRSIKKIHSARYTPIGDLVTYSPLPSSSLSQIDPFLFLNHHGPQEYRPDNNGLPFGPHPHRGMETVTFILEGDIMHQDTGGHQSVITAGGVQWMTAGSGLIHAEISSDEFKKQGGPLEILQLWLNLPSHLKMTEPFYLGLQKEAIPRITLDNGKVVMNLISGNWEGVSGAFHPKTDVHLSTVYLEQSASVVFDVPPEKNVFFYVIRGALTVNEAAVESLHLLEFDNDGTTISVRADTSAVVLFGYAKPFNEPVVAQGPFVMNTQEEIQQAYEDYRNGRFGSWQF